MEEHRPLRRRIKVAAAVLVGKAAAAGAVEEVRVITAVHPLVRRNAVAIIFKVALQILMDVGNGSICSIAQRTARFAMMASRPLRVRIQEHRRVATARRIKMNRTSIAAERNATNAMLARFVVKMAIA
jgi:hypothetical protein